MRLVVAAVLAIAACTGEHVTDIAPTLDFTTVSDADMNRLLFAAAAGDFTTVINGYPGIDAPGASSSRDSGGTHFRYDAYALGDTTYDGTIEWNTVGIAADLTSTKGGVAVRSDLEFHCVESFACDNECILRCTTRGVDGVELAAGGAHVTGTWTINAMARLRVTGANLALHGANDVTASYDGTAFSWTIQ